jgi:undecaprenyl diphosphate synthase
MGEKPLQIETEARHIAIIMDGNGRWAKKRGLPRSVGHQQGVKTLRQLVRNLKNTSLECLTLYAFSSENWKRSEDEVDDLMNMMRKFIKSDLQELVDNDIRLKIIGEWQSLASAKTRNGDQTIVVALNYGSQNEIARAAAKAASLGTVTEDSISKHLDTADLPPLDLLIRTSGEVRLSNFLLWQSAYAEMLFVDTLWPDFTPEILNKALKDFDKRERRYGGR